MTSVHNYQSTVDVAHPMSESKSTNPDTPTYGFLGASISQVVSLR